MRLRIDLSDDELRNLEKFMRVPPHVVKETIEAVGGGLDSNKDLHHKMMISQQQGTVLYLLSKMGYNILCTYGLRKVDIDDVKVAASLLLTYPERAEMYVDRAQDAKKEKDWDKAIKNVEAAIRELTQYKETLENSE